MVSLYFQIVIRFLKDMYRQQTYISSEVLDKEVYVCVVYRAAFIGGLDDIIDLQFCFNCGACIPWTNVVQCNSSSPYHTWHQNQCCVIWTALAGIRYCIDQIRTRRATVLAGQIWIWCSIVVKSSVLLSIWFFVIPVLIGLLFELLVIVPMRVPVDESPVFLLYQDWALGFVFLKIWTRLVMLDHVMPLMDDSWGEKFERVREDGF
ncbi:hypothetical protein L1987_84902 [Smallanthus sonchifolius]|uniref:Uncharacterized protein n=1 Tax=Smallanthus sonchifolius TaxID=185202 RepID=A0ACB8XVN6_9ASTR|nr:hypothetical protein L1987_84902 [Smallanthus sonchifolius]